MPTYDYVCSSCGRTTEVVHSINASGPAACPACGAVGTLTKAFNPPTIHFKGSGWAKKDRSGAGSKPTRASEAGSKNGSGAEPSVTSRDDAAHKDAGSRESTSSEPKGSAEGSGKGSGEGGGKGGGKGTGSGSSSSDVPSRPAREPRSGGPSSTSAD